MLEQYDAVKEWEGPKVDHFWGFGAGEIREFRFIFCDELFKFWEKVFEIAGVGLVSDEVFRCFVKFLC